MNHSFNSAIAVYSPQVQNALMELRLLILEAARETDGVGRIEEDLRWGQPSFLTLESGSGITIRIDGFRKDPAKYAMFFHCQSGLVNSFRELYADHFTFVGQRCIILEVGKKFDAGALKHCISLALTHHLRKKSPHKKRVEQQP